MHSHSLTECNGAGSWRALGQRGRAPAVDRPGLRNRQRIAAELMRVRMALDERLEDDAEARIVMVRDPDDGPGADFFEEHHLIHDMVAVMSGNRFNPRRMLRRAFIDRELRDRNGPARFHDVIDISGTGGCRSTTPCSPPPSMYWGPFRKARIEHEAFEAQIGGRASGRMCDPFDHRPRSVTLDFG